MSLNIPINNFKMECYKLSQKVCDENIELILTKHGKPLVRVMPLQFTAQGKLNMLKGTALMVDDLIDSISINWSTFTEEQL